MYFERVLDISEQTNNFTLPVQIPRQILGIIGIIHSLKSDGLMNTIKDILLEIPMFFKILLFSCTELIMLIDRNAKTSFKISSGNIILYTK